MKRVVLLALVLVAGTAAAKPKKKAAPAPAAAPVVEKEPIVVAPAKSTRADGLVLIHHKVGGPAVSARLFIRMDAPLAQHPARSAGLVTAAAALWGGPAGEKLSSGGAHRSVEVIGTSAVLGVDTLRERWRDDVGAMLDAVSSPALSSEALGSARIRVTPMGHPATWESLLQHSMEDLVPRDPAITLLAQQPGAVTVDNAVWHIEEMWTSDRMVLVVAGDVPPEEVASLVETRFLVPGAVSRDRPAVTPFHPVVETQTAPPPAALVYGQWAHEVPVQDALVIAAMLDQAINSEAPSAGECRVEYTPDAREPAVMALCTAIKNDALDVKNTVGRALDITTLPPPTTQKWDAARKLALARLSSDEASSTRMAERLGRFAVAGWDAGPQLSQAVATTTEASLVQSLTTLLGPGRAIRITRNAAGTE